MAENSGRYLISFEYEGRNFFGSQSQPDKRTVQDELNQALCTLIKDEVKIVMAGRLDRGVSAKCHTAHFDAEILLEDESRESKFLNSLNAILPADIAVFKIEKIKNSFHAQKNATFRHYRYIIRNSFIKPVFNKNVLFIRKPLNARLMNDSIQKLVGEYDFSSFKSISDNPSTVCRIYFANVVEKPLDRYGGNYLEINIVGNRFLYNMVRAIVGTLLMIEKDNLPPDKMTEILNSKNRALAGYNVEPYGLTLIKTGYEDPEKYIKDNLLITERQINEDI